MFVPYNRHLLVEPIVAEQDSSGGVILPEGYQSVTRNQYSLVTLKAVSPDSEKFNGEVGHTLVVASNMVQEVAVGEVKYHLVQENYVVGIVATET